MTPLQLAERTIDGLREKLREVTEERDDLHRRLHERGAEIELAWLRTSFGFTHTEARLVQALQSSPAFVSRWALFEAIYFDRQVIDYPEDKILDVLVCRVRKKMGDKGAVRNAWAHGYELTDLGRALVTQRLEAIKARRAAA